MSDAAIPTVPDAVGPLVGWRAWRIQGDGSPEFGPPRLYSIAFPCEWPVRRALDARCLQTHTPHLPEVPVKRCRCGIYAVRSPKHVFGALYHSEYQVLGEVFLWGRTVVGRKGWRAQRAYPKRLCVLEGSVPDSAIEGLRVYGVSVEVMGRDELAAQPATEPEPPSVWQRVMRALFT